MGTKKVKMCLFLSLLAIAACVSQTLPSLRFSESRSLNGPTLSIALADPGTFSFVAVGDLHVGGGDTDRLSRILDGAEAGGDSFLVLLGDIADKGVKSDFEAVRTLLEGRGWWERTLFAIGNHDIFDEGWENYRQVVGPSYYSVDIGRSRFLSVDTADGYVGDGQRRWLEEQLARPALDHTFVVSHYLPVIPGQQTYLKLASATQSLELMELASQHGLTAWLGGHYHSYVLGQVKGVDYLVAGGGGGRRMGPIREYFYVRVGVTPEDVTYEMVGVE